MKAIKKSNNLKIINIVLSVKPKLIIMIACLMVTKKKKNKNK